MKIEPSNQLSKVKIYSIITLFLVVVGSAVSFWVANRIKHYTEALEHTEEVLRTTDQLYAIILERETNIRGYILTGEQAFIKNYENSLAKGDRELSHIIFLTSDNSTQQELLKKLGILIKNRVRVFEISISYYKLFNTIDGYVSPGKIANAITSYREIKLLIDQINGEEEGRLMDRNESLINNIQVLPLIIGLISFFSILMGAITLYSIFHYKKTSKISAEKIKDYQDILNEKIELLSKSNNELKQFAYIASHDLQEPLRKITSFSDLLKEQYDEKLDGEGKFYVDRITSSTLRMRLLINDLLEYSRVGQDSPESINPVNLEEVLQSVLEDLEISIQEKNAAIKSKDLPVIQGKETELRQVFQNLISNSLKFSKKDVNPSIAISSSLAPFELIKNYSQLDQSISYHLIKFEDNGIGFDQSYGERIFIVFQRLHGKNAFEGTGIGLSIARKIIEKYGGIILAEGFPNQGATFNVVIPKTSNN
jgi:signal transduction histidine kinase